MIPETCPDHIPLKSLCCEFCPTKAQIRTYLTVLLVVYKSFMKFKAPKKVLNNSSQSLNPMLKQ